MIHYIFRLMLRMGGAVLLTVGFVAPAFSQGFAAMISPPRFELKTQPGERIREVLEITNGSQLPARYRFRTADWTLSADGQVTIVEELQPNSCRPWVAIEPLRDVRAAGDALGSSHNASGSAAGECRSP